MVGDVRKFSLPDAWRVRDEGVKEGEREARKC